MTSFPQDLDFKTGTESASSCLLWSSYSSKSYGLPAQIGCAGYFWPSVLIPLSCQHSPSAKKLQTCKWDGLVFMSVFQSQELTAWYSVFSLCTKLWAASAVVNATCASSSLLWRHLLDAQGRGLLLAIYFIPAATHQPDQTFVRMLC